MRADEIIELVISRHEEGSSESIGIQGNLHLEPVLEYGGKMARKAYQSYRKNWHHDRHHCGILDFKIMNSSGKMEHSKLLERSLGVVPIEAVRHVYHGHDPCELGLDDEALSLACEIQCSFIEQEVNWGTHSFQLRTHFGYPDMTNEQLANAVPRDFFMLYFERCANEIGAGASLVEAFQTVAEPQYLPSFVASKMVLMPPISGSGNGRKIRNDFSEFVYSDCSGDSEPWVNQHLERIIRLCNQKGISPYWNRAYE
jgi:hypothetical protein